MEGSVIRTLIRRFRRDDSGVTSIEYALIAVIVSVAVVASMRTIGNSVIELFAFIVDSIALESSAGTDDG